MVGEARSKNCETLAVLHMPTENLVPAYYTDTDNYCYVKGL